MTEAAMTGMQAAGYLAGAITALSVVSCGIAVAVATFRVGRRAVNSL